MSDTTRITIKPREVVGKANRRLWAEGLIPAVVYGAGRDPMAVSVSRHEFEVLVSHHAATAVVDLMLEGEKKPVSAVIKAIQANPVKGRIEHVDFMAVRMDQAIHTTVPVEFVGESAGEKTGGVIMHNVRELNVSALPGDLPEAIEVDVTSLEVGDSCHLRDVVPPAGVTILDDPETILCSVTAPTVEPTAEEVAAEVEPEVIGGEETAEEA